MATHPICTHFTGWFMEFFMEKEGLFKKGSFGGNNLYCEPKFPKFYNYESGQSVSNGSSSPTFISLPFHGYSTLNRSKMSR